MSTRRLIQCLAAVIVRWDSYSAAELFVSTHFRFCFLLFVAVSLSLPLAGGRLYAQASGLSQRYANSTINFPDQPRRSGYALINAFGTNTFLKPVCIQTPPGEINRVFVLEKGGVIDFVTDLDAVTPLRFVYLDLRAGISTFGEQGLLGLAFHPGFQTNGYFFIYRSVSGSERLSRFQAIPPSAPTASATTELILFTQSDPGAAHNGGDLHFGTDGYLYVSLGDGDVGNLSGTQTIRLGFTSGIMRIDVDNLIGNLAPNPPSSGSGLVVSTNYSVPSDNPFVGGSFSSERYPNLPTNSIRAEFWAVGLRNPWRFSIDDLTGWIWAADVGETSREEVDIIVKGGNYGWPYREGSIGGVQGPPPGFKGLEPIFDYSRWDFTTNTGNSVIGGLVYRGTNISQLAGAYVFCDYVSGNIWSLRYDGTAVTEFQNLQQNGAALREFGIVAFGTDPRNGDILLADYDDQVIRRLIYTSDYSGSLVPPTLADSGLLSTLNPFTPSPGVIRYEINVPTWSDGAVNVHLFSVPNTNLSIGWSATNNWLAPTGTVWAQHLLIGSTRIETRVLVRNSEGAYGVTYRWGGTKSNAVLVAEEGANDLISYLDNQGVAQTVNWIYPSQNDCRTCHNAKSAWALAFNTAQLNRSQQFLGFPGTTGATDNQLHALTTVGYFSNSMPDPAGLPALAVWNKSSAPLEWRVRSYLAANCAQCHQSDSLLEGFWDARYFVPTPQTGIIWGPLRDNFGIPDSHVISPKSPGNSMLYQRVARLMGTQMPPLATTALDTNDINLIAQWIATLNDPVRLTITPGPNAAQTNLRWPYDSGNFDVYTATNVSTVPWIRMTDTPSLSNGEWNMTVPTTEENSRFFRLQTR